MVDKDDMAVNRGVVIAAPSGMGDITSGLTAVVGTAVVVIGVRVAAPTEAPEEGGGRGSGAKTYLSPLPPIMYGKHI